MLMQCVGLERFHSASQCDKFLKCVFLCLNLIVVFHWAGSMACAFRFDF